MTSYLNKLCPVCGKKDELRIREAIHDPIKNTFLIKMYCEQCRTEFSYGIQKKEHIGEFLEAIKEQDKKPPRAKAGY